MRPAFRRGWEGEGKPKSTPWRGPAGAQQPPHGGVYFGFGNERAKPLAFPPIRKRRRSASPKPLRGTNNGTLARRDAAGWCVRATVRQRPSGKERGKSASGSAQKRRALRSAIAAGKSASLKPPAHHPPLPIVTRMGRDYRPGSRQRIERVARQGSSSGCNSIRLKGLNNRASPLAALGALIRQAPQRFSRGSKGRNPLVNLSYALVGQFTRPRSIFGSVQGKQLSYLCEREPARLCGSNKTQTADIGFVVSPNSAISIRLCEQAPALVKADGLHAHSTRCRQFSYRHRTQGLTPYYATEPI